MVMTGNRGFDEWADIFDDIVVATALLDRLLHHAVVIPIEGNSYRLSEHAALIPEHLRGRLLNGGDASATPAIRRRPEDAYENERRPTPRYRAEHPSLRVGKFTAAKLGKSKPVLTPSSVHWTSAAAPTFEQGPDVLARDNNSLPVQPVRDALLREPGGRCAVRQARTRRQSQSGT